MDAWGLGLLASCGPWSFSSFGACAVTSSLSSLQSSAQSSPANSTVSSISSPTVSSVSRSTMSPCPAPSSRHYTSQMSKTLPKPSVTLHFSIFHWTLCGAITPKICGPGFLACLPLYKIEAPATNNVHVYNYRYIYIYIYLSFDFLSMISKSYVICLAMGYSSTPAKKSETPKWIRHWHRGLWHQKDVNRFNSNYI